MLLVGLIVGCVVSWFNSWLLRMLVKILAYVYSPLAINACYCMWYCVTLGVAFHLLLVAHAAIG